MRLFNIIVAVDAKNGIGRDGNLPWSLSADLKYFKKITTENAEHKINVVVMGRKTWDSIPENFRPLKDRINIVLTRNQDLILPDGVSKISDLNEIKALVELNGQWGDVFFIGGQQVFDLALNDFQCDRLYITHIKKEFACDTFFPKIDKSFQVIEKSDELTESDVSFYFSIYEINKN